MNSWDGSSTRWATRSTGGARRGRGTPARCVLQRRRRCRGAASRAPLATGIRAIDGLLTCGKGQRLGIFAGSGVGKSVLLGMIARNCTADVNVIALVGERGREVREFLERDLGPGRARASRWWWPPPPTSRRCCASRRACVATTIAEYFRDQGLDVLLMMDSLTRVAMAQREVGLAVGEPPATKGYPPSVFALLPRLLERAGMAAQGSITGLYTVLVEGDDMNEPVADTARAILDGHIVLSRKLAAAGHYPAIDVLESVSRVMTDIIDPRMRVQLAVRRARRAGDPPRGGRPGQHRRLRARQQCAHRLRAGEDRRGAGFLRQGMQERSRVRRDLGSAAPAAGMRGRDAPVSIAEGAGRAADRRRPPPAGTGGGLAHPGARAAGSGGDGVQSARPIAARHWRCARGGSTGSVSRGCAPGSTG